MNSSAGQEMSVSPLKAGLTCSCPRCGAGRLFTGYLALAPACEKCGLDYSFADAGDGPAVFVILLGGLVAVLAVLAVELAWQPPYWVHAVVGIPVVLVATLLPLRWLKSLLIALQFHHKAAEARIERK
ncbi:MAG TPA: DUF983 domain-containing protein [Xanthobacteraceae bacterium]|nr:DUF983 domain-containing protein [Xanthobacteraceae bacterium]